MVKQVALVTGLGVGGLLWGCSSSDGPTAVQAVHERGVILGVLSASVSVETPHGRVSSGTIPFNVTLDSRKAGARAFESAKVSGDAPLRSLTPTILFSKSGLGNTVGDLAVTHRFTSVRGQEVTMYVGGASGPLEKQQPPRLIYHYVNGKVADVIEAQYKKRDGRWIAFSGRMIAFDSAGKNHHEVTFALNEQEQQALIIQTSPLTRHGRFAAATLAALFGPRELYARESSSIHEIPVDDGSGCGTICTVAATEAARALTLSGVAAKLAFDCLTGDPYACTEAPAAIKEAAQAASSAGTWAASCYSCLNPPAPAPTPPPAVSGGSGGGGYCVYRITYYVDTGEVISTELLYCVP